MPADEPIQTSQAPTAPAAKRKRRKRKPRPKKTPPHLQKSRGERLSPRLEAALDLIADEAMHGRSISITEAAQRVGMRREALSRALRRGSVTAQAAAKVRELLGGAGLTKAGATAVAMLSAESEYVRAETAFKIMAIAGIKPKEQGAAGGGRVSVTFNLQHARPAIDVTPRAVTITHSSDDPEGPERAE